MAGYKNYQVNRNKSTKGTNIFETQRNYNNTEKNRLKDNKFYTGVKKWAAHYRRHPHRFALDYLGIKLRMFQIILLNAMFMFPNLMYLAARG